MKNRLFSFTLLIALFLPFAAIHAQDKPVRYLKQHKTQFIIDHLQQTEAMIVYALENDSTDMKESAVQTIRELQQVFPDQPFTSFIDPLNDIVRDEVSDTHLRILAALALDELHSDKGDKAIRDMSIYSTDQSLKHVCAALTVTSSKLTARNVSE